MMSTAPTANPTRVRSRRLRVAMLATLPARPQTELVLALRLGHRRGEFDALEPGRALEPLDERARRVRLPDELHALGLQAQRLEPGVLGQQLGQIAQEGQDAHAVGLHARERRDELPLLRHLGGEALDGLDLGIQPADLLREAPHVAVALVDLRAQEPTPRSRVRPTMTAVTSWPREASFG